MQENFYGKYSYFKNISFLFFGKSSLTFNGDEITIGESRKKVKVELQNSSNFWINIQAISDYILYVLCALELSLYFAYLSGPTAKLYMYLSPYVFLPLLFLLYYWKGGYREKTVSQKLFIQYLLVLLLLVYSFLFVALVKDISYTYKITQIVFLYCLSIFFMLTIGEYDKIKSKGHIFKGKDEDIIFICFDKIKKETK